MWAHEKLCQSFCVAVGSGKVKKSLSFPEWVKRVEFELSMLDAPKTQYSNAEYDVFEFIRDVESGKFDLSNCVIQLPIYTRRDMKTPTAYLPHARQINGRHVEWDYQNSCPNISQQELDAIARREYVRQARKEALNVMANLLDKWDLEHKIR